MENALQPPTLRFRLAMGFICTVLAALGVYFASQDGWFIPLLAAITAAGLIRRLRWGRSLAVAVHLLMALMGIGLMLPSSEFDQITGATPRPLEVALVQAFAVTSSGLLGLHLLSLYKRYFRAGWF